MSDLISRSELILRLSDYALQESLNDNESTGEQRLSKMIYDVIQNCITCVEQQPTAYDVSKVVEELNEWIFNADVNIGDGTIMNQNLITSENAIEIVKQGGVETDDECESKGNAYVKCRTQCSTLSDNSPLEYTYCHTRVVLPAERK